jgi:hypothetical protein
MKGVDRAGQYLAYYSLPKKTMKWTKKVALWLIDCAIFNSFLVYKNLVVIIYDICAVVSPSL